ncbi:MAG: SpoIVB peptidase S55 domain-containing protein [Planctomycetota bacterium]|jgi:hypothetical protein
MLRILAKKRKRLLLFCLAALACSVCGANGQLDRGRYITVDEIRPGMDAYCLTVYQGTEVEKFDLEVLSVVRDVMPGKDWILVQGTDKRFIRTGPVGGCSGSPVYIDGRLAGALAYAPGWPFSKDPLYGVTPIAEMLRVGEGTSDAEGPLEPGLVFDFSQPIDFAAIDRQITTPQLSKGVSTGSRAVWEPGDNAMGLAPLPCPLVASGLPAEVVEQLDAWVKPFGLTAVAGLGGGGYSYKSEEVQLVPGACLAVPLITGDIKLEAMGTVTEVVGDKVYGFGHRFLGYGRVDLPMATGQVHAVVARMLTSWKFTSSLEIVGALTTDESTAILGRVGAKAKMIPMTIRVDRYNDAQTRVYECQLAHNRLFTPLLLRLAAAGAVLMLGTLPPDHTLEYAGTINVEGAEPIAFENVSSSAGLGDIMAESSVPVAILMNNPYKTVDVESIEMEVRILPKSVVSHIWSVDLSDSEIKAGEEIEITVVVESFLAEKKKYRRRLRIPKELEPKKYELVVCGGYGYRQFLMKTVPYRFVPRNLSSLVEAINDILHIKRDKLYFLLALPSGGVAVEGAELPDLPATKALVLQDAKRTLTTQPYQRWVEESLRTGTIIIDSKTINIKVKKE